MEKFFYQPSEGRSRPKIFQPDYVAANDSYWFQLFVSENEEETCLRYKVKVACILLKRGTRSMLRIDRISEVLINEEEPELLVDQLAYETGKVFYPLIINVDHLNRFLSVENTDEIAERWQTLRSDLSRYFAGPEAEKYLKLMDKTIANPEKVDEIFRQDLFISTFFAPVYKPYTDVSAFTVEEEMSFPVSDYTQPTFIVKQEFIRTQQEGDDYEIIHTGISTDTEEEEKSSYSAHYFFDVYTNRIRQIEAEWILASPENKRIRVILFPERKKESKNPKDSGFVMEEEKQEEKKGFFSRIFGT